MPGISETKMRAENQTIFWKTKLITQEYGPLAGPSSFQLTSQWTDEDQDMVVDNPAVGAASLASYSSYN
jgi:hypothetical protein